MNVDIRPPRWRWLNRALYAFFALWLSVWLDRTARVALGSGLVMAGALLAGSAPDLRNLRLAAETAGTPLSAQVGGSGGSAAGLAPLAQAAAAFDPAAATTPNYRLREPAGGRLPLVVVDLDQTPLSRHLQRQLGASTALQLIDPGPEYGYSQDLLRQGRALGLLVLPEHLQDSWLGPPRATPVGDTPPGSGSSSGAPGELTIDLYSGAGPLGRQRALLVAINQVLQALPSPHDVPGLTAASLGSNSVPPTRPAGTQLGLIVARNAAVLLDSSSSSGSGGGSATLPQDARTTAAAAHSRTAIELRLAHLDDDARGTAPALLAPPWLPALLALPVARPGTALLIVQQTLLVVVCMLFATWTQQHSWPVRRNWSSYLGVWAAVAGLALLGCLCHLLPGRLAGWFDPAPGTRYDTLAALLLLYAASLATVSIWLASLLRQREGGLAGLALLTLPLLTLTALPAPLQGSLGTSWPEGLSALLPALTQGLAWLLPATSAGHGITLITETGAGWAEVAHDFALLGAIGTVALAGGLYNWREPLTPGL
jgi:hypothetical protein